MTEQTPTEKKVVDQVRLQQERDIARWLNYLRNACHENSLGHGFWLKDTRLIQYARDKEDAQNYVVTMKLMLEISETIEAFEGIRIGNDLKDEHCPEFSSFEIEMADKIIRICDLSGWLNLRLGEAVVAKMAFNKTCPHMHGKRF